MWRLWINWTVCAVGFIMKHITLFIYMWAAQDTVFEHLICKVPYINQLLKKKNTLIQNYLQKSSVCIVDHPSDQRDASHLSLLVHFQIDQDVSSVRGLMSDLRPEQHNLPLSNHNCTTCKELEGVHFDINKCQNLFLCDSPKILTHLWKHNLKSSSNKVK